MKPNTEVLIRFGKSVFEPYAKEYDHTPKARAEMCRDVQHEIAVLKSLLPLISEIFGEDVTVIEYELLHRSPERIVREVSDLINNRVLQAMSQELLVVGIEIEDTEYAAEIAARIVRGPLIFVSATDDDGMFALYREIK